MRTRQEITHLFEGAFPVRTNRFWLELYPDPDPVVFDENEDGRITVRLVTLDHDEETGTIQIRDVKEQQLFVPNPLLQATHLPEFLQGWRRALASVFESQERFAREDPSAYESFSKSIDCLMPYDLISHECFDVLRLKKPRSVSDIEQALLGSRKRLGGFLAPTPG
jgi:hypothetical protein